MSRTWTMTMGNWPWKRMLTVIHGIIHVLSNWNMGKSVVSFNDNASNSVFSHSYDKCNNTLTANSPAVPQTKSKKHFRSASCDVKMIRSFAKDHNTTNAAAIDACEPSKFKNLKKLHTHSRNNSSDLNTEFRHKLVAHSNSCSRDDPNFSIRFIQNQLKPQEDEEDEDELTTGCGHFVRKHSRNHSYDQIYMPNNIRFDPEFFRGHHHHHNQKKNVNLLKNVVENKVKNSNETNESAAPAADSRCHSRNNSKDLNIKVAQTATSSSSFASNVPGTNTSTSATLINDTALSILRHRRTNSKDLNHTTIAPIANDTTATTTSGAVGTTNVPTYPNPKKHSRNPSHQKIQIDDDRSGLIGQDDEDDEDQQKVVSI